VGHTNKAVVIGAGISGLACAFRLQQLGIPPLVLEASAKAGGIISTINRNGFIFEGGPQFPRFPDSVWRLVKELKLGDEFVAGNPKAKRHILRDGRLHPAPFSAPALLSTRLLNLKSKFRLLSEPFQNSHPPATEESLAEFVQRKFGSEVLDYLVDPFISTIFFSDAHNMGMQSAFPALVEWERSRGSVARGAISAYKSKQTALSAHISKSQPQTNSATLAVTDALPSLGSFRRGMGTLTQKLSETLKDHIHFAAKVESVAATAHLNDGTQSYWRILLNNGEEIFSDALVMALPAFAAAVLFQRGAPKLSSLLAAIEHSPLGVVASAYKRNQVRHPLDGFGFMVPQREGLHTICTFWNSSLFPEHAPNETVLMTSFARKQTGSALSEISDELLSQTIEAENAKILGITGGSIDRVVWQYPEALPQYNVGHAQRVAQIRQSLAELPGLYLAGNFLAGRSIGDCAESGFRAAEDLHRHFQTEASK
jgi:oxygen-dependent protoporphyrinogen oxidase